jgi:hypothetical protein
LIASVPEIAGEIHGSHPAAFELPRQTVPVCQYLRQRGFRLVEQRGEPLRGGAGQHRGLYVEILDESLELRPAGRIVPAQLRDQRGAPFRRRVEKGVDERRQL